MGAAAAAAALLVTGRGDAFLLAALLTFAAPDSRVQSRRIPSPMYSGVTVFGVAVALLVRWGTSSLPAIAGAQAVLGPAVAVGPVLDAVAVALAAAALVLAAPAGLLAAVFGAAAGLVLAGPSWTTVGGALLRVVAIAGGAAAAWWLQPRLPDRAREAAPVAAVLAVVAAVLA